MNGSCLCGEIRYVTDGDIVGINYCHCVQCRKASGTAFATNAVVAAVASKAPWYEIRDELPQLQEEEGLTF